MRRYANSYTQRVLRAFAAACGVAASGLPCADAEEAAGSPAAGFSRLSPLPTPKIVGSAEAYPGGAFNVSHLTDGDARSQYSSAGKGTETFVEFDFGRPVRVAAFRHIDRNDPATVSASKLVFADGDGKVAGESAVTHVNEPGGVTNHVLASPVTARRVRWQVTGLGPQGFATVGGSEVAFFSAADPTALPTEVRFEVRPLPALERKGDTLVRPVRVSIDYPYAEPVDAAVRIEGVEPVPLRLGFGERSLEVALPAATGEKTLNASFEVAGKIVTRREIALAPVRQSVIYILPHSHVDIGYTELQTAVEKKQMSNIARGIELARATAGNPEGARYKWNVEVLWAVDSYLRQSPPEKQQEFIEAVRRGWVGLDAMYGNQLTALCRPEELLRLFRYATELATRCGVPIQSAMISDVPGYTWGTVSAMAQAGVKYWSIGPNYMDRIGRTMCLWENTPFYWVGPSGRDRVLCWVPYQGYAISHILRSNLTAKFLFDLMVHLEETRYPYDLVHLRWSGHGDNAVPDEKIPEFVKDWNARYEHPRLVIATTTEAFRAFEQRYGGTLPQHHGDWTPHWEDGAGSSARETAINRDSAERLVQAETLWALLNPARFPAAEFRDAWRNVLLYSEHTWGAYNSITEPDCEFVRDQWKIKQAFALDGEMQAAGLLRRAFDAPPTADAPAANAVDVYNTNNWPRTDLVVLPKELAAAGDAVTGPDGTRVPSQRLSGGQLAILAEDVPPFAAKRYTVGPGSGTSSGKAVAAGATLQNGLLSVRLDEKTGAIIDLRAEGIDANLADAATVALNDYFFVAGNDSNHPLRAGPAKITVREPGPLVASLLVESEAPGCRRLSREVRVTAGLDRVEIINVIDKKRAEVRGKPGDWGFASREAKEGLHFGFAFHVPDGVMRMDIPWAVARPEVDQLPGACRNWFTVQRWVDVSNDRYGVTWSTLDAPLVEVGALTANLLGSQTKPEAWIDRLEPTQTFYSWVMNNHWHTNYRAYQEGPTTFRYAIRPHRGFVPDAAARFGTGLSQPLLAVRARGGAPAGTRLQVEPPGVLVTAFKPSDDGKAMIVRLFGASGRNAKASLRWSQPEPQSLWLSDIGERPIRKLDGPIDVPAWGIVTLRASAE